MQTGTERRGQYQLASPTQDPRDLFHYPDWFRHVLKHFRA